MKPNQELLDAFAEIDRIIETRVEPNLGDYRHVERWHGMSAYGLLLKGLFTLKCRFAIDLSDKPWGKN
jgi:hypothetical protein